MLFRSAPVGVRAEAWLAWWYARVSFAEEAGRGRTEDAAAAGERLVAQLGEGLARYGDIEVPR